MNAETFSKIASGIQSIAVVVGLAVGGWWALNTFIFQNPTFYEKGGEVVGRTSEVVNVDIDAVPLDAVKRIYEIRLKITNSSKTISQIIPLEYIDVVFFKPGDAIIGHAKFFTSISDEHGFEVPTSESRVIHLLGKFPGDGVYLIEADLSKFYRRNCLAQKYISIGR
jgi:hypothetical protein